MSLLSIAGSTPSDSGFELKSVRLAQVPRTDGSSPSYFKRLQYSTDPDGWRADGNLKTWTLSWWMKHDVNDENSERWIYWVDGDNAPGSMGYDVINLVNHQLQYYCYVNGWSSLRAITKLTRVFRDPSAWYHCVLAMDSTIVSNNDRLKIYVNGVRETSFATDSQIGQDQTTNTNMNANTYVGSSHSITTTQSYGGYFAEWYRIDGQALGPEYFGELNEDTNQWQPKNPTDIKQAVTFGMNGFYLPFSNDALATSFTDADYHVIHTVTPIGTTHTDTTIKKFGTASCQLDGNSDYLSIPDSGDWVFDTGDFTLEAWLYNTTASGTQRLFCHTAHNVSGEQGFNIILTTNSTGRFTWSTNGIDEESWNFANCMDQNTWTHFALTRTGTSLKVFKNGALVDSTTDSDMTTIYGGGKPLFIGAMNQSNSSVTGYFEGYIDEVRFSNIVRYYGSFSVATAAFTADKYTKLLLHMDGSDGGTTFTDSSWTGAGGTGYPITAFGSVTPLSEYQSRVSSHSVVANGDAHIIGPKIGSSAITFDGTGDYLSCS